jgi:hypothetical protein
VGGAGGWGAGSAVPGTPGGGQGGREEGRGRAGLSCSDAGVLHSAALRCAGWQQRQQADPGPGLNGPERTTQARQRCWCWSRRSSSLGELRLGDALRCAGCSCACCRAPTGDVFHESHQAHQGVVQELGLGHLGGVEAARGRAAQQLLVVLQQRRRDQVRPAGARGGEGGGAERGQGRCLRCCAGGCPRLQSQPQLPTLQLCSPKHCLHLLLRCAARALTAPLLLRQQHLEGGGP